ncbi:MAG TPA: chemotaxis protein CheA [Pseudogracilibacillus sp.]|nr:chemotaxis protein CheA [Pseudogracilibacillus sp.]
METTQYLDIFIDESTEHLDTLYQQMLELEKNPEEKSIIEEIFRAAHTLKGMSATMGYDDLANLTHKLENVFDGIRYDKISVKTEMMDDLFHAVDHLNEMVSDVANGGDGRKDVTTIVDRLEMIEKGIDLTEKEVSASSEQTAVQAEDDLAIVIDEFQITIIEEAIEQGFTCYEMVVELSEESLLKAARVYMVFDVLEKYGEVIYSNPSTNELEEENFEHSFRLIYITKEAGEDVQAKILKVSEVTNVDISEFDLTSYKKAQDKAEAEVAAQAAKTQKNDRKKNEKQSSTTAVKAAPTKTIRVNIERLDVLMNLFEELVIDRGRLEQISLDLRNSELQETVERMSRVSSDLQNIILTMRMVPIDTVFNRFPRMIRQLARDLNKEVEVEILGADTELDRTVIDEIGDPLVHLIRNAIDHGIEMPDERLKNGKARKGKITLEAYHSGNHVFVEIIDDGAGINRDVIEKLSIERGIITQQEADVMSDQQVYELILTSGFSTNKEVSDVSGRGVGLDVVKTTIESLGGSVTIDSEQGRGSVFSIQLPLTLSIISVLLIELQNEKYAIPLSSIIETAILKKSEIFKAHDKKVIDFRGNIVPLAYLNEIFDVPQSEDSDDEFVSVVIVRKGNKLTGLVVDSFIGQQEVVLKSLGNYLTNVFAISGATILGDGEVALIVDSNALIK